MTIKFIWWIPKLLEYMPRYSLVNTQKKPLISTVDYTSAWPSQAGLILAFFILQDMKLLDRSQISY